MWIARDKDGELFIYGEKPYKFEEAGVWNSTGSYPIPRLDASFFPEVKWEDDEPTELILKDNSMKIYTKEELEERDKRKIIAAKQIIKQIDECRAMIDEISDELNKESTKIILKR